MLPKIAVNGKDIVNTKDIIAAGIPTGDLTIKGPYEIVHRVGGSRGCSPTNDF